MVCGETEIVGGVTSFTTITCVHDALPVRAASSSSGVANGPGLLCENAVHVIVVVPVENGSSVVLRMQFSPLASQVNSDLPSLRAPTTVTLSPVVDGLPTVTEASQLGPALTSWLAGQLIVGGSNPVSSTVTVKLQLPPPVAELTVTVVVPTGKNEPEGGVAVTAPQSPFGSAASNNTIAPRSPLTVVLAVAVMLSGHASEHACGAPATIMVNSPDAVLSTARNSAVSLETVAE